MTLPVRLRLGIFSAVLIAAVLATLGVIVYLRLQADLQGAVDDGLAERAQALIDDPPAGPTIGASESDIGDVFAAVVGPSGDPVATSAGFDPAGVLDPSTVTAARSGPRAFEREIPGDEGPTVVRILVTSASRGQLVVTGVAFDDQRAALDALREELLVAGPIAMVLALVAGWLVGRAALRPVDRMRREAEAISDSELDRRLTVVPTGDELASLGRSLNRMLDRLEVAVERERRLVDDASHELRTPLANLQAELDLALRRARSEPELLAALRSAADETDRLSRLAADLLVLARAHRGQLPIDRRDVDLAGLVESSIGRFDRRAGDGDVLLEARTEAALRGRLDAVRLGQALDNVIENALRHTPRGGRVVIEARRDGDAIVVSVTDSGSGFTPGLLDEAFEPFRRADEGRARADGGAGLGLAITRAVARAHGGDVAAWNGPSGGAVVELRFPA